MTDADAFHFPPDLLNLLIEAIPAMFRTKLDVLVFFKGCGVPMSTLDPYYELHETNQQAFRKHKVTREILVALNSAGDRFLKQRREVLKRVVEFSDFSSCYDDDRDKAQSRVAQIRQLVNAKDTITRIEEERQRERAERLKAASAEADAKQKAEMELDRIQQALFSLFAIQDGAERGRALEPVLNSLFAHFGILVKESFTLRDTKGTAIEQIDGAVALDGQLYLVEMKWRADPIGPDSMATHVVRVYNRGDVRGLFISASEYTEGAVSQCKEALSSKTLVLMELNEIVQALDKRLDFADLLRKKVQAAILMKNPLYRILS